MMTTAVEQKKTRDSLKMLRLFHAFHQKVIRLMVPEEEKNLRKKCDEWICRMTA